MKRWLATALTLAVWAGVVCAEPLPGRGGIPSPNRSRPRITVRLYDGTRIDAATRKAAVTRTRRLLDAAGLSSQFHDCSLDATSSKSVCETSPQAGDLIVRMVQAPPDETAATHHVLGFASIDTTTRRGTMATVFTNRVAILAALAHVPLETILSRTIAHEIGHLLLGTSEHGAMGLMREVWTLDELASGKKEHWSFTAAEVERLHGPV